MKKLCASLICGMFLTTSANAETIRWFVEDWPPFHFIKGSNKYQGIDEKLVQLIHQYLPEYQIDWVKMNIKVFEQTLQKSQNFCNVAMFKTHKREAFAHFSKQPSTIDLSPRVFMLEDTANRYSYSASTNLQELFTNKKLRTQLPEQRSYTDEVDALITHYDIRRKSATKTVLKRFFKGKLDYIIEYSPVVNYYARENGAKGEIIGIPIKVTSPYVLSHVACTKNTWGEGIINKIDTILGELVTTQAYKDIMEEWHDEKSKQALREHYKHLVKG